MGKRDETPLTMRGGSKVDLGARRDRFKARNARENDTFEVGRIGSFRSRVSFHLPQKLSEGVQQGAAR